jgi:signal transduction histidine kinase
MLQGQRDLATASSMILSELAPLVSAQHAVFYSMTNPTDGGQPELQLQAGYGYEERKHLATSFRLGEGLVGQCAKEKKRILLTEVPADYVQINSGLGASTPLNIIVLPVLFEGSVRAVIELASFSPFSVTHQLFLDQLPESIGLVLNTIDADTLTQNLLRQSQSQAEELRSQQEELRETNEDLGHQARLLAEKNLEAEQKNQEVEQSKRLVEEKAGQLAVSSKYKSEFIANMSHELRTPLNSLLILAQQLADNPDRNLTATQVEYASVIHTSGKDLLELLNSILDLAKVESGTVTVELHDVSLGQLRTDLQREFEHVAQGKSLGYTVTLAPGSPAVILSDQQRLRQILNNLLANAFKFTERGDVNVEIGPATAGWSRDNQSLSASPSVIAMAVRDTGIGINSEQQQRIFEAFAQGDGTTARLYGGTGLGLSISRELVGMLGGEITVTSAPGAGSTFTIYLPSDGLAVAAPRAVPPAAAAAPVPEVAVPTAPVVPPVVEAALPLLEGPGEAVAREVQLAKHSGLMPDRGRAPGRYDNDLDGTRVLVVDDDFRNIFAMTALLERGKAKVTVAESGHDAIAILERTSDIDIVLMDIMMPIMDGYATIRAIRSYDRYKSLPIVAVTGKVMPGERQRCLDAGANDFVPKPVDTAELLAVLGPWLTSPQPTA